jgi:hypothetical protein
MIDRLGWKSYVLIAVLVIAHAFIALTSWSILFGMAWLHPDDRDPILGAAANTVMVVTHLPLLLPLESTYQGRQWLDQTWPGVCLLLLNSILAIGGVVILVRRWRQRRASVLPMPR